jgi:hypothetical protein
VAAFSRLLLTSSEHGAVAVAVVLGVLVLGTGSLIAAKPKVSPNVVAGLLTVIALGIVTVGVVSAARGERFIERHAEEHSEDDGSGNQPNRPEGTEHSTTTTVAEGEG